MNRLSFVTTAMAVTLALAGCTEQQSEKNDPATTTATIAQELTVERLYDSPSFSGKAPVGVKLSPDGNILTLRKGRDDDQFRYDLWQLDMQSGEQSLLLSADQLVEKELSDEEKARRERMRVYGSGIMSYAWGTDSKALLIPSAGSLYYYTLGSEQARQLNTGDGFVTDPKLSPKGNYVSYVKAQNLYVYDLKADKEIQLTFDGQGPIKNAMSEFVAQEEMDRMTGYWWSPTEEHIAFLQVDETPVELVTRNEIYADGIKLVDQRYPYAGTANVDIKLAITDLKGKRTWIDLGDERDIYIPRVDWQAKGEDLTYQWQDRPQHTIELRNYNLASKQQQVLLTESDDVWLNLHHNLKFLKQSAQFIWTSERSGFSHLYLYNNDGSLAKQLTKGDWQVDKLVSINETAGKVYFSGRKTDVLEVHLYELDLATDQIKQISKRAGTHSVSFANAGNVYIDRFSSDMQPPQVSVHDAATGDNLQWIEQNQIDENHPLSPYFGYFQRAQYGELTAEDGKALKYRLFKPHNFDESKQYPVIVRVYGGPHAQLVANRWSSHDYFTQYLLQQGYLVFQLDNRGSANRGTAFEQVIYKHLGEIELQDQIVGAKYLQSLPYVDGDNIGIYGHSYGGYMSIMASFKAGDTFKAAVAGAPVTDWALYDTHYTERYLGHPLTNAKGYELSSVFPYAKDYQGGLFIYHGMADDNVLFTNATKLYKTLQDQGSLFTAMDYPGSKHSMRGNKVRTHMYRTITAFFDEKLK
ncbi:S9 family peptidase [Paraferrimonas sp. SM1919]|uniref:S9 family peptidase n=1 Tax=Paraferrimonas sp. SM1919 TaxID=2662263 RepID=UPI001969BBE7|nr:S9 family peptidase [Paraferrimonas sp. SM1919]